MSVEMIRLTMIMFARYPCDATEYHQAEEICSHGIRQLDCIVVLE
jgi:hypothetical protein